MRLLGITLSLILCALAVHAQVETLRLGPFTGINTTDIYPKPGEAVTANETDLSRSKVGTIAKRYGFDKIDSLTVVDTIDLLYPLQFNDGTKYMMVIGTDADSGWGRIYISNEGSANFEDDSLTLLYSHVPITKDLYVAKLRDQYYVTTGVGRGCVIGRFGQSMLARPFPMMAPGEPLIVPFDGDSATQAYTDDDTLGISVTAVTGTVRYLFRLARDPNEINPFSGDEDKFYSGMSYLSSPVKVTNGNVYITNFQWMSADSGLAYDTVSDTCTVIKIYRSLTDVGSLDAGDYGYAIGQIQSCDPDSISNLVFIDHYTDAMLRNSVDSCLLWQDSPTGFDENTDSLIDRCYGAPGYVSRATFSAADTTATGDSIGVYWGWPEPEGIELAQGVAYTCAFIDTLTSVQSDTGRSLIIVRDQSDTVKSYTLSLPCSASNVGATTINLYRAALRVMAHTSTITWKEQTGGGTLCFWYCKSNYGDTTHTWTYACRNFRNQTELSRIYADVQAQSPYNCPPSFFDPFYSVVSRSKDVRTVDTVYVEQFRLVGQIPDTATTYTDTLRYDSLLSHKPFEDNTVPPFLSSTFAFNGRLYGADGNNFYRSDVGTTSSWGVFDYVEIDPGFDEITAAWPTQYALAIAKQFSRYGVSESEFVQPEIVGRWGCLAPKSFAMTPAGPIYLSAAGIVLETQGQYLERAIVPGIISEKINHILSKTPADLQASKGIWLDREQQYWWTCGDTTWVWDLLATKRFGDNVWTTFSIAPAGGAFYDATNDYKVIPGRTLYFWRNGDARIYQYGKDITYPELDYNVDSGGYSKIVPIYKTGPLLWGKEASQIRGFGMVVNFDGVVADSSEILTVNAYDVDGTALTSSTLGHLYRRYLKREVTLSPSLYYQLTITGSPLSALGMESGTAVEMLEIYYIPDVEKIPFEY